MSLQTLPNDSQATPNHPPATIPPRQTVQADNAPLEDDHNTNQIRSSESTQNRINDSITPSTNMVSAGNGNIESLDITTTEPGAVIVCDSRQSPRSIVPATFVQAKEAVRLSLLDNSTCKAVLKAMKVSGVQNAKVATKLSVIAAKMAQRSLSVNDLLEAVERLEEGSSVSQAIEALQPTAVKIEKTPDGKEEVTWLRGDLPIFEGDEIVVGRPDAATGIVGQAVQRREPDFEASEYCRLLHVLADARMKTARAQLMKPRTREELDVEPFDPWTDQIAPLFNDETFRPSAINTICGGVIIADISSLQPSRRLYERSAGVLKRKFGEFKSAYGTSLSKYEASGQSDPDGFVLFANARTYIMYAFCFLTQHPLLQPLATRALQSDAQREEGVGDGVSPSSGPLHGYGRKRKREKQEISIVGLTAYHLLFDLFQMLLLKRQKKRNGIMQGMRQLKPRGNQCNLYCQQSHKQKTCLRMHVLTKKNKFMKE